MKVVLVVFILCVSFNLISSIPWFHFGRDHLVKRANHSGNVLQTTSHRSVLTHRQLHQGRHAPAVNRSGLARPIPQHQNHWRRIAHTNRTAALKRQQHQQRFPARGNYSVGRPRPSVRRQQDARHTVAHGNRSALHARRLFVKANRSAPAHRPFYRARPAGRVNRSSVAHRPAGRHQQYHAAARHQPLPTKAVSQGQLSERQRLINDYDRHNRWGDSYQQQSFDSQWWPRRQKRQNGEPVDPFYSMIFSRAEPLNNRDPQGRF